MSTSGNTRTTLISPFQYFADPTKARPVFNGFIYIGRVDGDPTNPDDQIPIQLICECGGTPVNVTQPVRTGPGGVPIYNGNPAQIVVCRSNYSITLQDKDRVQVYHSPNVQSGFVNQPITHLTLAAAMADDNSSRNLIRILDRGGAEFRRAADDSEFSRFPASAKFTDASRINWVLNIGKTVNMINLGLAVDSDIRTDLQFLLLSADIVMVDKNYTLSEYVYFVSDTTLDLCGNTIKAQPNNTRMFIGAINTNTIGGYGATRNVVFKNGIIDRDGRNRIRNDGPIASFYHMENVQIQDIAFLRAKNDHCFEVAGCRNVIFDHCEFSDYVRGSRNDVEHLQIESVTAQGGTPAYGPYDDTPSIEITIRDCIFGRSTDQDSVPVAAGHHAVPTATTIRDIRFIGNSVTKCTLCGFRAFGRMEDILIEANSFIGCTGIVVHAGSVSGTAVSPKNIQFVNNYGMNISTTGNTYNDMVRIDGSRDDTAEGIVENIVVTGNNMVNTPETDATFVRCQECDNVIISANTGLNVQRAATIIQATEIILTDNVFNNASQNFILADTSSMRISIISNRLTNCDSDSCIFVRGITNIQIKDNIIIECNQHGINLTENTSDFDISGNHFEDFSKTAVGQGIRAVVANNGIIHDNVFKTIGMSTYSIDVSSLAMNVNAYNNVMVAGTIGRIRLASGGFLTVNSPNGSVYNISVNDSGVVTATELT